MAKIKNKCFNCGQLAYAQVNNVRPPHFRKWICMEATCWTQWRKLAESDKSEGGT